MSTLELPDTIDSSDRTPHQDRDLRVDLLQTINGADALGQYEKIRSAFHSFGELFRECARQWAGKPESDMRAGLLEPALRALGFDMRSGKAAQADCVEPDYRLLPPGAGGSPLALCLAYCWGRSLDGKDDVRDTVTPDENPGAAVVSLLQRGEAPWAIVTNGKIWRLYSAKAHLRATNYYEIDLEESLALAEPSEAFRFFWLLFRREAFEPTEVTREGETRTISFLDSLAEDSKRNARELGERLKERVFEEIFPHFAEGFIAHIRRTEGLHADLPQDRLDRVFQGTLTILFRLLFLLYAESRDLLPVKEARGYWEKSLTRLKAEVAESAGRLSDDVPARIKHAHAADSCVLYDRLLELFGYIDKGDPRLNLPTYNGGLFVTDPDPQDSSIEAENARFLLQCKLPDRFLALGLDRLARDLDPKRHELAPIDYKSLGVRHLGSIYEGLLEFKLRVAPEKMAIVRGKKTEEVVAYREAVKKGLKIITLRAGDNSPKRKRGSSTTLSLARRATVAEQQVKTIPKGGVYLENDKRERKATGSYYTPDSIVKYIVEHTVGPVLDERFEELRPRLREAQKAHRDTVNRAEAFEKRGQKPDDPEKTALTFADIVDRFFAVRVLDPAMGSGHFLVEAADFISDRMLDFLNRFPWNPVQAELRRTRETILSEMERQQIAIDPARLSDVNLLKRQVLKRSIYGVDLDPMAVELAKVSLWLDCFTLGAPLSFLAHHIKCGNSLVGARIDTVRDEVEGKRVGGGKQLDLFGSAFAGLLTATKGMIRVGEISDVTLAQVKESARAFRDASSILEPFKQVLDLWTSQHFANPAARELFLNAEFPAIRAGWQDRFDSAAAPVLNHCRQLAAARRFFHWELEFPEVFFGTSGALKASGFDAVIGNPPYGRIQSLSDLDTDYFIKHFSSAVGKFDLYVCFTEAGYSKLGPSGQLGFIVPNKFVTASYGTGLRKLVSTTRALRRLLDFGHGQVFPGISTYACLLFLSRTPVRHAEVMPVDLSLQPTEKPRILPAEDLWTTPCSVGTTLICTGSKHVAALGTVCEAVFQGLITGADGLLIGRRFGDTTVFGEVDVPLEPGIMKPLLKGKDVRRFHLNDSDSVVIYPYRAAQRGNVLLSDDELAAEFPATFRYLLKHKKQLADRGSDSMEYEAWYALWCPRQLRRFESAKIVTQVLASRAAFALDAQGSYCFVGGGNAGVYGIIPRHDLDVDTWYLLGVLNSKTFDQMVKSGSSRFRGGYFSYARRFIEHIPIPLGGFTDHERRVVARVSELTQQRSNGTDGACTEELEQESNELIAMLYRGT